MLVVREERGNLRGAGSEAHATHVAHATVAGRHGRRDGIRQRWRSAPKVEVEDLCHPVCAGFTQRVGRVETVGLE